MPRSAARAATMLLAVASALAITPVHGVVAQAPIELDEPSAAGNFGETITFLTDFRSARPPRRVDLLVTLPGDDVPLVRSATVEQTGPDSWRAGVHQGGHVVPNTMYRYRFRVIGDDGVVLGPEASHRVLDERVEWQQLAGDDVTVWWHRGDRAFAERALAIAEEALASASDLLGVGDVEPVDFFIYADSRAFRQALGPGTRENVGGQAHPDIRTLFGLIEPRQVSSDWVDELVTHELAHLVFDEAVDSPYGYPPTWLNEGLAVYLSKSYDDGDRALVEGAARAGSIIPLEGLGGRFPTRPGRFGLAYAESVSAVAFLVDTYGQDRLVELITSFADGRSLEEGFEIATGDGFLAFEDAWLASVGAERPEPYGPVPDVPGATPEALAAEAARA